MIRASVLLLALLAVILGASTFGHAQTRSRDVMIYGLVDALSCGTWIKNDRPFLSDTHREVHRAQLNWIFGYVSGASIVLAHNGIYLRPTETDGIEAWTATYCNAHPLDALDVAAGALVAALTERQP